VLVQKSQHSAHQHDEKSVQRPPDIAVCFGGIRGVGITAVLLALGLDVVAEAQVGEKIDENVGVLLVQLAVRA